MMIAVVRDAGWPYPSRARKETVLCHRAGLDLLLEYRATRQTLYQVSYTSAPTFNILNNIC